MAEQLHAGDSIPARAGLEQLSPKEQFWWGFLGGCLVLGFRLYIFTSTLTDATPWPSVGFRTVLLCVLSLAFPIASGFLSLALGPHYRLAAVFEGASVPALFFWAAEHFPG